MKSRALAEQFDNSYSVPRPQPVSCCSSMAPERTTAGPTAASAGALVQSCYLQPLDEPSRCPIKRLSKLSGCRHVVRAATLQADTACLALPLPTLQVEAAFVPAERPQCLGPFSRALPPSDQPEVACWGSIGHWGPAATLIDQMAPGSSLAVPAQRASPRPIRRAPRY